MSGGVRTSCYRGVALWVWRFQRGAICRRGAADSVADRRQQFKGAWRGRYNVSSDLSHAGRHCPSVRSDNLSSRTTGQRRAYSLETTDAARRAASRVYSRRMYPALCVCWVARASLWVHCGTGQSGVRSRIWPGCSTPFCLVGVTLQVAAAVVESRWFTGNPGNILGLPRLMVSK